MKKTVFGVTACLTAALCVLVGVGTGNVRAVAEETTSQVGYASIYESKTKLTCAPTVLAEVKDEESLTRFTESETPPSTLILHVNDTLQVKDLNGNVLCSLNEALDKIGKKCAAAVYVENETQAAALVEYCALSKAQDIFAIASESVLLKSAVSGYTYLLGILDVRGKTITYGEACSEANLGMAKIVLADKETFTYSDNRMLKALQVSVWTEANGESEVFDAMYENYTGILTEDPEKVYGAYEKLTTKTLSDTSVFVGHRGSSGAYPENSVEACRFAIDCGVEAIEYDVHLTKDKQVVVMHDDDISTTTNGTGKASEMTLAQIRQYKLVGSNGATVEIPTLADMLEAFKNDDVIHYIEYKANNTELVGYVQDEIEKAGMEDKVLFISFYSDVLTESQTAMPQIPIGQLWGNYDTRDYLAALESAVVKFYAAGKTNHCAYTYLYKQYIETGRHRGVTANGYTFTGESWQKYFYYDMGSLTLDDPTGIGAMPLRISAEDVTLKVGEAFAPVGQIVTATDSYQGKCSLIFLDDGGESFTSENGEYTALSAGEYEAVLTYTYDDTYAVLSQTVTITVEASDGNGGCSSVVDGSLFTGGALALVGVSAILAKKRKED